MSSFIFPVYTLSQENILPENTCDIVFEKTKGRGETVNKMSVNAEGAVPKVL